MKMEGEITEKKVKRREDNKYSTFNMVGLDCIHT